MLKKIISSIKLVFIAFRVHWFCGNAAHILSIVTIFTSVKLEKAELPSDVFDIILVSYVVIHVIAHLLFSVS